MKIQRHPALFRHVVPILAAFALFSAKAGAQTWTVIGWNDLGIHCTDGIDFSVFSVLPPYNTLHAQIVDPTGNLLTQPAGMTVTYEAVSDTAKSINTTSIGKTNFWTWVKALFGAAPAPDTGLAGFAMPGSFNAPKLMTFEAGKNWFTAQGVPITPYPDGAFAVTPPLKNYYPMFRLKARDSFGNVVATTDVVVPISDEMDCRSCHASGSNPSGEPAAGWVYDPDPNRDVKLNILRLHDDRQSADPAFASDLALLQASPQGLYATVTQMGKPVLCASCHASNALGTAGFAGTMQFTSAMHTRHAGVVDPTNGLTLDASLNRFACYRCHPGAATKCLRGAMGNAVAADGTMAMQCQSCHGGMSTVGSAARQGWLNEPKCQSCHTGTATSNAGQIRFTSVFSSPGVVRTTTNTTFATNPNTPATGLSLYRFSAGHGGIQCEACHGSTHAELPSSHANDNVQSLELQNHVGMLSDCDTCHAPVPPSASGGPHGIHPVGQSWATSHGDAVESSGTASCQACHGTDYRGTVLSRALGDRTIATDFGTLVLWRGFQVSCYACHNGPSSEYATANRPPVVRNASTSTMPGQPVALALSGSDPDGNALAWRIVGQPFHGTVGLSGGVATYFPERNFLGTETFTFAAWDGLVNSNLGSGTVTVQNAVCSVNCSATVPASGKVGSAVSFQAAATLSSCTSAPSFNWDFGDGTAHGTTANQTHTYLAAGTFTWKLVVSANGATCVRTGSITVTKPCGITCGATVPTSALLGQTVGFKSTYALSGCAGTPAFNWNFGDGTVHATTQNAAHVYKTRASFTWRLSVTLAGTTCSKSGVISIY